jgi:hypothetical protein
VDAAVLHAVLVNHSAQFLAYNQIGIIDNIEQFIRHTGTPENPFNKGRKGNPLRPLLILTTNGNQDQPAK